MSRSSLHEESGDPESAQTPFLSTDERKQNYSDHRNVQGAEEQKHRSRRWLDHRAIFQGVIYILAIWGLQLFFHHLFLLTAARARRVPPGNAGAGTQRVRLRTHDGRRPGQGLPVRQPLDSLAAAVLPRRRADGRVRPLRTGPGGKLVLLCRRGRAAAPGPRRGRALGEAGGSFWASRDWHVVHCLYYWRKYARMRRTGTVMEARFDSEAHVEHCTRLIRKPAPDHFFLIEVPVMMNSSDLHHHRAQGS
ncbi:hypothetical protein G7054_g14293 [Neopestalotiopsis clavispora]|nr:hypothetical protein G7054_g14293 [Neopestalotiopsis clavispora]